MAALMSHSTEDHFSSGYRHHSAYQQFPRSDSGFTATEQNLTVQEIGRLRDLIYGDNALKSFGSDGVSIDSDYPEYQESTHAWAIFADDPKKRAGKMERVVGTMIILFQLMTYWMFASEAIEDYQDGQVVVMTGHADCIAANEEPQDNFTCEANFTNDFDAFVAFFMLGIFLTGDFIQAGRTIRGAPKGVPMVFACLAGIEIVCAYLSACISVSYNLYIGEVTDAIEVGVGLLFVRELSQRAYAGIRSGKKKQYKLFFGVLTILVVVGMITDPLSEKLFGVPLEYR